MLSYGVVKQAPAVGAMHVALMMAQPKTRHAEEPVWRPLLGRAQVDLVQLHFWRLLPQSAARLLSSTPTLLVMCCDITGFQGTQHCA